MQRLIRLMKDSVLTRKRSTPSTAGGNSSAPKIRLQRQTPCRRGALRHSFGLALHAFRPPAPCFSFHHHHHHHTHTQRLSNQPQQQRRTILHNTVRYVVWSPQTKIMRSRRAEQDEWCQCAFGRAGILHYHKGKRLAGVIMMYSINTVTYLNRMLCSQGFDSGDETDRDSI